MMCKKESNARKCPCDSLDCLRRGVCCECVAYHRGSGSLPACLR